MTFIARIKAWILRWLTPPPPKPTAAQATASVEAIYQELLGRSIDPGAEGYIIAVMNGLALSEVRELIMDSREYRDRVLPPVVVPTPPVEPPAGPSDTWTAPVWWKTVTEDQLRSFRGDLGGMRVSERVGPNPLTRPSAPRDYVFTPTYCSFDAAGRKEIRDAVKQRGYTHMSIGPIWERGYPGFKPHNFLQDPMSYIRLLRELIDDHIIPVIWLMVDGPCNVDDQRAGRYDNSIDWAKVEAILTPIYSMPEFQEVCKVAVFGWEVTDNDWVCTIEQSVTGAKWMARVVPNAFRYWHMAANKGAGCKYEIDGYGCERDFFKAMGPYLHGSFWQDGSFGGWYIVDGRDATNPAHRKLQYLDNLQYEVKRIVGSHYFQGGLLGADGKVWDVIAGEYSAYFEYNDRDSEDLAIEYGRLALSIPGVRGFLDGGPRR